jgi:integrase
MNPERALKNLMRNIKESNIPSSNKNRIYAFVDDLKAKNKAANTIIKYLYPLYISNKRGWIAKDFNDLTKEDLKQVVLKANDTDWTAATKKNFKLSIKIFYRWLEGIDEPRFYPERVRWIVASIAKRDQRELSFDDMITRDEVKQMADAAFNAMHRAFVWTCFESTGRPQENLQIKYSDVKFDSNGCIVLLNGAKDKRPARLVTAAEYLAAWLQVHPLKNEKDFPIWVTQFSKHKDNGDRWTQLEGKGANKIIKTLAERTGIKKRVTMYSLRKGRLTELASSPKISTSLLKSIVGWQQNSSVADRYIKFSAKDIDNAILAANSEFSDKRQRVKNALSKLKVKDKDLLAALIDFVDREMD